MKFSSLFSFFFLFSDLSTDNLRFLSSRQALADLAHFRTMIAETRGLTNAKWVAFGGSYPGSLAAWFRLKYPHLVHAAVATSAPVHATVNFPGKNNQHLHKFPSKYILIDTLASEDIFKWLLGNQMNYSPDVHHCYIQRFLLILFVYSAVIWKYGGGTFFAPTDSDQHIII